MMRHLLPLFFLIAVASAAGSSLTRSSSCKCHSPTAWSAFNATISGRLLQNTPIAAPCYPGPLQDASACAALAAQWPNVSYFTQFAAGYAFPTTETCDLPGRNISSCALGNVPVYAVNASSDDDVSAAVRFAAARNLRVVVKSSGHDTSGRSAGAGGLEIWMRALRTGLVFGKKYGTVVDEMGQCQAGAWDGAAIEVGGGYGWGDVDELAREKGVVVVGGSSATVTPAGGYILGGGHSSAQNTYGLGSDQLLSARVVLASGEQVLANPCQNADLFAALRGGGPGYGIMTSITIKAYPESSIASVALVLAPKSPSHTALLDFMAAVQLVYEAVPGWLDGGLSGYGSWSAFGATANGTASLAFGGAAFNASTDAVGALVAGAVDGLARYNDTLDISVTYASFSSYSAYFAVSLAADMPAHLLGALTSRLLPRHVLESANSSATAAAALAHALNAMAGKPSGLVQNVICAVGGRAGSRPPSRHEPTGVNPAWRRAAVHHIASRVVSPTATWGELMAVHVDMTRVKGGALRELAPDSGAYMNEADSWDPDYLENFYGKPLGMLEGVKRRYDTEGVFYCPTCVGSDAWEIGPEGRLCRVEKDLRGTWFPPKLV